MGVRAPLLPESSSGGSRAKPDVHVMELPAKMKITWDAKSYVLHKVSRT